MNAQRVVNCRKLYVCDDDDDGIWETQLGFSCSQRKCLRQQLSDVAAADFF